MPKPYRFDPPLTPQEFERTPMGQALLAGRLVATAVSDQDGKHITVRLSCKRPPDRAQGEKRWQTVGLAEATRVFVDVPKADLGSGDKVGDLNVAHNTFWSTNTDQRRVNAARYVILAAAGRLAGEKVLMGTTCLRCGRALTDPVSIKRNIGPECYGKITGSAHERKNIDDSLPREPEPPFDPFKGEHALDNAIAAYNDVNGRLTRGEYGSVQEADRLDTERGELAKLVRDLLQQQADQKAEKQEASVPADPATEQTFKSLEEWGA